MLEETISFVMSVCPSVLMELGCRWTGFHKNFYLVIFRKSVQKIQVSLQSYKIADTLHKVQYKFFIISRSALLRIKNVSDRFLKKIKINFMFKNFFFPKIIPFNEIMWK